MRQQLLFALSRVNVSSGDCDADVTCELIPVSRLSVDTQMSISHPLIVIERCLVSGVLAEMMLLHSELSDVSVR